MGSLNTVTGALEFDISQLLIFLPDPTLLTMSSVSLISCLVLSVCLKVYQLWNETNSIDRVWFSFTDYIPMLVLFRFGINLVLGFHYIDLPPIYDCRPVAYHEYARFPIDKSMNTQTSYFHPHLQFVSVLNSRSTTLGGPFYAMDCVWNRILQTSTNCPVFWIWQKWRLTLQYVHRMSFYTIGSRLEWMSHFVNQLWSRSLGDPFFHKIYGETWRFDFNSKLLQTGVWSR